MVQFQTIFSSFLKQFEIKLLFVMMLKKWQKEEVEVETEEEYPFHPYIIAVG